MTKPVSQGLQQMLGWLKQSVASEPIVQTYELQCACGQTSSGEREAKHQQIRCATCNAAMLVLPADVYPRLAAVAPKPAKKSEAAATKASPSAAATPTAPAEPPRPRAPNIIELWHSRWQPWLVAQVTPLRLIALGIVLVISMSSMLLWHRAAVEWARGIVDSATESGLKALKDEKLDEATQHLGQARQAIRLLGRNEPASRRIVQTADELDMLTHLYEGSWADVSQRIGSVAAGNRNIPALRELAGSSLLLDVNVHQGQQQSRTYLYADVPLATTGKRLRLRLTSPLIHTLYQQQAQQHEGAVRCILAGRLPIIADSVDQDGPLVTMPVSSLMLWADEDTLARAGLVPANEDDARDLRDVLARQRQTLGLEDPAP